MFVVSMSSCSMPRTRCCSSWNSDEEPEGASLLIGALLLTAGRLARHYPLAQDQPMLGYDGEWIAKADTHRRWA